MYCVLERAKQKCIRHTKLWVYTPLLPSPISFYTKSTVTQLHSHTLAGFTANQKITLQKRMLSYPINYYVKNVDHKLPWDFTANLKVSKQEVFQTTGKRLKDQFLSSGLLSEIFFFLGIYILYKRLCGLASSVTKRQKQNKIPLGEQISATQECYASIPKYCLHPERVRKPTHSWGCGAECFQQDVAPTTGMAVS